MKEYEAGYRVSGPALGGDAVSVELIYPRMKKGPQFVEVHLEDVRAADGLRIHYDFDRDGWSIAQASTFQWSEGDPPGDDWQEVAFVRAWARERRKDPQTGDYVTPRGLAAPASPQAEPLKMVGTFPDVPRISTPEEVDALGLSSPMADRVKAELQKHRAPGPVVGQLHDGAPTQTIAEASLANARTRGFSADCIIETGPKEKLPGFWRPCPTCDRYIETDGERCSACNAAIGAAVAAVHLDAIDEVYAAALAASRPAFYVAPLSVAPTEYTIPPPSPYAGAEAPPKWAEQHRLQLSERSGVYFIACAGRIKIGVTTNIAKRFKVYQTMCPHEPILVALVRGDAREEAAIHRHFDDHWSHGEWFHMGAPLLEAVGRARRTGVWRPR